MTRQIDSPLPTYTRQLKPQGVQESPPPPSSHPYSLGPTSNTQNTNSLEHLGGDRSKQSHFSIRFQDGCWKRLVSRIEACVLDGEDKKEGSETIL